MIHFIDFISLSTFISHFNTKDLRSFSLFTLLTTRHSYFKISMFSVLKVSRRDVVIRISIVTTWYVGFKFSFLECTKNGVIFLKHCKCLF